MGNIQVKNVPDDVHHELRRRAEQQGLSIRDYVLDLILRDQELPSMQDWLSRLRERESVSLDRPAADLIAEGRREREAGLDAGGATPRRRGSRGSRR